VGPVRYAGGGGGGGWHLLRVNTVPAFLKRFGLVLKPGMSIRFLALGRIFTMAAPSRNCELKKNSLIYSLSFYFITIS